MMPVITYHPDTRTWRLEEDWHAQVDGCWWLIPAPFDFDLASVPRCLWWLIAPYELGEVAPLCHDWLYRHGGDPRGSITPHRTYTRPEADALLLKQAAEAGAPAWRRYAAYIAVRLFGWLNAWRGK